MNFTAQEMILLKICLFYCEKYLFLTAAILWNILMVQNLQFKY